MIFPGGKKFKSFSERKSAIFIIGLPNCSHVVVNYLAK
jgi:hypothetical protein